MAAKSDDVIAGTAESGQYPEEAECGARTHVTPCLRTNAELTQTGELMDAVSERSNLMLAYQRVMRNKGAAGVDAIPVSAFKAHLKQHWPMIKARLLAGDYIPLPVRRVEIPKPDGGVQVLGIPTVTDRLIQQAIHQVLSPLFEPTFHTSSYGFRAGRSAHQAVEAARRQVSNGRRNVVDIDLKQCLIRSTMTD